LEEVLFDRILESATRRVSPPCRYRGTANAA
jgi:hypothetical protein